MTTPIFNLEKSIHAALYVASKVKRKDFHKIFKVIYFADREHLSNYGVPITGDLYIAMSDGPVPSFLYDIFKVIRGDSYYSKRDYSKFSQYFVVKNWNFIEPKTTANLDYLSESNIEELDKSIELYGSLSWDEIREKSHDYAWRNTAKDHIISLEQIMLENGETDDYIQYITSHIKSQQNCL
ncbi:MAG: Panacea domain-containing protein [Rikenellaceae bacterium]